MAVFGTWIKRTVQQVLDPDREQRTQEYAKLLLAALQKEREQFSLDEFSKRVDITTKELEAARNRVYRDLLARAWKDGQVTQEEKAILSRAACQRAVALPQVQSQKVGLHLVAATQPRRNAIPKLPSPTRAPNSTPIFEQFCGGRSAFPERKLFLRFGIWPGDFGAPRCVEY